MKPSELIDQRIAELTDWRGEIFLQLRKIILETDQDIEEGWKWNTGVWLRHGLVCAVGAMKDAVKINFFQGASLKDPHKLFNAGLEAKKTRAIDFHKEDIINEEALKTLIREAITFNKTHA